MIFILASIEIKDQYKEEFIRIFKENVPRVLAEEGCLGYVPTIDFETPLPTQTKNSNMVTIVEQWRDYECLQKHSGSDHMNAYRVKVKDMIANMTLKVLQPA